MIRTLTTNGTRYRIKVADRNDRTDERLYASIGDFPVYDEDLYASMTEDAPRTRVYEQEIRAKVKGKVVLDIGTGAHANWAVFAARCGAKRVYAIEYIESAFDAARALIEESGLDSVVTVIRGLSTEVTLPETVDVCISDLIGCTAGSEGAAVVIADAKRRFVKRGGDFIVGRCETRIAACTLGREFRDKLGLTPGDVKYVAEIFAQQGRPFDIRVTVGKFPLDWVVSTDAPMEVLDFHGDLDPTSTTDCVLEILQDGCIDGFVGWLNLFGGTNSAMLDTLRTETSWPPLFFPVFYPGQEVQKGDRIEVATTTFLESSEINPDYLFEGRIFRGEVCLKKFRFYSRHVSHGFRETPFYQELFPESG